MRMTSYKIDLKRGWVLLWSRELGKWLQGRDQSEVAKKGLSDAVDSSSNLPRPSGEAGSRPAVFRCCWK